MMVELGCWWLLVLVNKPELAGTLYKIVEMMGVRGLCSLQYANSTLLMHSLYPVREGVE